MHTPSNTAIQLRVERFGNLYLSIYLPTYQSCDRTTSNLLDMERHPKILRLKDRKERGSNRGI
jgi:hypothetical protein